LEDVRDEDVAGRAQEGITSIGLARGSSENIALLFRAARARATKPRAVPKAMVAVSSGA
jgi:hypothetical protein